MCFVLVFVAAMGCAGEDRQVRERRVPLQIGGTTIDVVIHEADEPGITYLNLHDDENTAVEAGLEVIGQRGGRLIELQHTGDRDVSFQIDADTFRFDPNRMFTSAGIDSSLSRLGTTSEQAHAAIETFADSVLSLAGFDTLETIVTVHNNSEDRYSARSYSDGGPYARDARFVHLVASSDADDFFFVTTQALYDELRAANFNVVMQDNALVTDDGSLSVLAGNHGTPYVNAEAQHGHFEAQHRMLVYLDELLSGD